MRIEKKVWPEWFQSIIDGKKPFDIRLADFACKPGDTLVLKEWDPKTKEYTGRVIEKKVTYVARLKEMPFWKKEDIEAYGFQVIGFK